MAAGDPGTVTGKRFAGTPYEEPAVLARSFSDVRALSEVPVDIPKDSGGADLNVTKASRARAPATDDVNNRPAYG
ncbi:MAG: hypothetical protein ACR2RL_21785 [Gammaproteobacteria bacterium]